MLTITTSDLTPKPFPFVLKQPFIEPELYRQLKAEFPPNDFFDRAIGPGSRSGRDLYRGDAEFDAFMQTSPAWRTFYEYINSEMYMRLILDMFGPYFSEFACKVDPAKATFSTYWEPRENLHAKSLLARAYSKVTPSALKTSKSEMATNDLYSRFDIQQGGVGYDKAVHCDRPNRLVSMVIYFCDADDIGMKGGELSLHEHRETKPYQEYERHPHADNVRTIKTLKARDNLGLLFLCSNNSYHSVAGISALNSYRNFTYINISSRAERIW
jgi:hypothetical protein